MVVLAASECAADEPPEEPKRVGRSGSIRNKAERFDAMRKSLKKPSAEIEKEGPDWWKRLSPNGGGPIKRN